MRRALRRLPCAADHVVVDGLPVKHLGCEHEAVVDGDALVHSIGCASIVAKVVRDRLMKRLSRRYPGYAWDTNVGYGTPAHLHAIRTLGPTPHHRLTFGGSQFELEL
jgi:ribonuclease HII